MADASTILASDEGIKGVSHDSLKFWQFMVTGSIASSIEHMAMLPIDTLKTRMQVLALGPGGSVGQALRSIMKVKGALGLYRGINAMALDARPAHAVYFSVYKWCKSLLGRNLPAPPPPPLAHAVVGVVTTIASDAVFTPMDVVKYRLQLKNSPYRGVVDCIGRIMKEGLKGFYASYRTTIVVNAPFTAVHFATYETAKRALMEISPDSAREERLLVHVTAGVATERGEENFMP